MKLKRLFCLFGIMATMQGHAYDFDVNGIYYNKTGDNTVEVTFVESGEGNADFYYGTVTIPNRVSKDGITYTVTAIGWNAFNHCTNLTKVNIGENVTSIGSWAFAFCSSLTSITLPSGVTSIGDDAFHSCISLTSIALPSAVTSIGEQSFSGCSNLKSLFVSSETPPTIGGDAFDGTPVNVFVPNASVDTYKAANGWSAYADRIMPQTGWTFTAAVPCDDGTADLTFTVTNAQPWEVEVSASPEDIAGALTIPAAVENNGTTFAVKKIADSAFAQRAGLTNVVVEEGITTIEYNAFRGSGLTSIKFPSTVTYVGIAAFRGCSVLKTVDFNGCTAEIDAEAFIGTAIEELTIPETVMLKGWTNFGWCPQLRTVVMTNMNQTAHHDVFKACGKLETAVLPKVDVMTTGYLAYCPNLQRVTFLSGDAGDKPYFYNFSGSPDDVLFTVPEGTAGSFLKKGYRNLSDKSGLPLVRAEFDAEAARIAAMANLLGDGDKKALSTAIDEARTAVQATDDYLTVYAQIAAIKSAARTFLTTATLTKDFDVTAATIVNPDLDRFHLGWQLGWAAYGGYKAGGYTNGDIAIENFVESYPETEGNIIYQTIKQLPAGIYRLEADIIATTLNDAEATVTGVSLFAGGEKTAVSTENQKPQHFSVKFENPTTKDMTVGIYVTGETNAKWVALDNVRLIYEGAVAAAPAGTELVSSEEDTYYIYNVDAGMYLNGGNGWGTQAVLAVTGLPVRMTQDGDGYWQVYFREGSRYQQLLYVSSNGNVFTDSQNDGSNTRWVITESNGSYTIQSVTDLGTGIVLGNDPFRQDINLRNNVTLDTHIDVIRTDNTANNTRWQFIKKADYDLLMAKRYLLATIFRMEQSDTRNEELLSTAQSVYDDDAATIDAVVAVTALLNSQMGMPTEDAPIDMTALIVNPRFENNTTEGWTGAKLTNTGNEQNTQQQTHEFFNTTFDMSQTITGVPNGLYRLKWKGFHRPGNSWSKACTDFAAGKNDASAQVYANSTAKTLKHICEGYSNERLHNDDVEYNGQFLPNQQWDGRLFFDKGYYADSLEVEVTDNQLTVGVRSTDAMNDGAEWVLFSDFELLILENAETYHNKLLPTEVKALSGCTVTMPVSMENADDITSLEFNVLLPQGVTLATDEYNDPIVTKTERTQRLSVSATATTEAGNNYKVLIYGVGKKIAAGNGPIVNLQLQVPETMEIGSYQIQLYNIVLGKSNGLGVKPFSTECWLNITEAEQGDANHDMVVSVADIITIASHILNRNPQPFDFKAADINADNDINAIDISQLANIILYGTPTLARAAAPAADGLPVSTARAAAANGDTFAATDVTLDADGRGILDVSLSNTTASAGYEFELRLPEGISIATDADGDFVYEEGSRISSVNGFITSISQRDGYYKVLCFNDKTRAMQGTDGTVVSITIQNDGKANGTLEATLTNCRISDTFKTDYLLNEELPFTINTGGLRGDVNHDHQVGIGDIVAITNFMAGNAGTVTHAEADVNGDGDVGIGDIVAITNIMAGAE